MMTKMLRKPDLSMDTNALYTPTTRKCITENIKIKTKCLKNMKIIKTP